MEGKMVGDEEKIEIDVVAKLLRAQEYIDMLNRMKIDRLLDMEDWYNFKSKPLQDARNQITKSIPDFWPCLFSTHPVLRQLVTSHDLKIFDCVTSLEVEDFVGHGKSGYSITFNFGSNQYFDNTSLTKTFSFLYGGTVEITATPIQWKEPIVSNEVGHEKSFFKWFQSVEQKEKTEDKIADFIKGDLWPNLLSFLKINPDQDVAYDEVTKKDEVENNQFDGIVHSFEKMLKIQEDIERIDEEAKHQVLKAESFHSEVCAKMYRDRDEAIKAIPQFWSIVFLSHPVLTSFITVKDEQIFKHLISLEVENVKDINWCSVTLIFEPNTYFENTKLTKTVKVFGEGTEVTTTPIKWKECTVLDVDQDKKQKMRSTSSKSFFEWFRLLEPEEMEEMHMDDHYHDVIGDIITEDLWENPLAYFNNEEPNCDKAHDRMVRRNNKKRSRFDLGPHGYEPKR